MSLVNGVNYTKTLNPISTNIVEPGKLRGKKRVHTDTYEASTLADGSVITVGEALPVGAIVTGVVLGYDALGGSTTLAVGDATTGNRYLAAASTASAGVRVGPDTVDGMNYVITGTADTLIKITLAGAAATGTIKIVIEYEVE